MRIASMEQQCMSLPFHERVAPLAGIPVSRVVGGGDRYACAGVPLVVKWEDKA